MANVIKTVLTYQLDGSTRDFNIPFEYLARKFVVVTLIGVDRKALTLNTDYRFATRTTISLTKSWGPADGYTTIELRRVTSTTDRLVDFTDGSILRAYDLNVAQIQTMHVAEEARDLTADTIGVNNDGHLDARGRRIVNLANAVDDRDAVPLGQLKTMNQNSWQARNEALQFRNEAETFRNQAEGFKNESSTNATNTNQWRYEAKGFRDEAEQFKNTSGQYADAAGSAAGNAKDSEDEARRIAASIREVGLFGYITRRSFEKGFNVTTWNEVLLWEEDGAYYRWDGTLPKNVPAGSTPESSGGVGLGAWLRVDDVVLRQTLSSDEGFDAVSGKIDLPGAVKQSLKEALSVSVNITSFGADPTGIKDSSDAIQAAIDAVYELGGGEVFIPKCTRSAGQQGIGYKVTKSIMLKPFVNLRGEGINSCLKAYSNLGKGLLVLMHGGGISGRYLYNFRLQGNGTGIGIGTDIEATADAVQHIYGFDIQGVCVELFETGMQLQGLWHSTLRNCTTSSCRMGLHLWGQNVSINITGCHFRRDHYSTLGNTFGIRIQPKVYAWSPDQSSGSRSEAIVIDGETMCISVDYGIYVDDCLDLQMSNLDLDYIRKIAVAIINVNGGFNLSDSWIAGDSKSTEQFFAVTLNANSVQQQKSITGLHCNLHNANPLNNNIGINITHRVGPVYIGQSTFVGGWSGIAIFNHTGGGIVIDSCTLANQLYLTGSSDVVVQNSGLTGIAESLKPSNSRNWYRSNRGTPATNGVVNVPIAAGATSGTLAIPNADTTKSYCVRPWVVNPNTANDTASCSAGVITVNRPTAVGVPLSSLVEYSLF